MLKLDSLLAFVTTAEAGSISEAARRLQISKSVASERLAELERNVGVTLVHRSTRKLVLTEDGSAFLERAKRILREVSEATAEVSERRGELVGPLRISAPVSFCILHLASALSSFSGRIRASNYQSIWTIVSSARWMALTPSFVTVRCLTTDGSRSGSRRAGAGWSPHPIT
jgi:DNA-binding transcriptional LysR family regulator